MATTIFGKLTEEQKQAWATAGWASQRLDLPPREEVVADYLLACAAAKEKPHKYDRMTTQSIMSITREVLEAAL